MFGKNKYAEYIKILKDEIHNASTTISKRTKLIDNKLVRNIQKLTLDEVAVRSKVYSTSELHKIISDDLKDLRAASSSSYYKDTMTSFISEIKNKSDKDINGILDKHMSDINKIKSDMQDKVSFCVESFREITKMMKQTKSIVQESAYSDYRDLIFKRFEHFIKWCRMDCDCYSSVYPIHPNKDSDTIYFAIARLNEKWATKVLSDFNNNNTIFDPETKTATSVNVCMKFVEDKGWLYYIVKNTDSYVESAMDLEQFKEWISGKKYLIDEKSTQMTEDFEKEHRWELSRNCFINECLKQLSDNEGENKMSKEEIIERKKELYEKCAAGEITFEERETLISELNDSVYFESMSDQSDEKKMTNKEKFNAVKKVLYERCSSGEITLKDREKLIDLAESKYLL